MLVTNATPLREGVDMPGLQEPSHSDLANAIRFLALDAIERANSGHPGMPLGIADVATVLFTRFMKFDPACPDWPDRDRFILSAGHGSMLLYALGYLTGYPEMTLEQIRNFRQLGSRTPGHPERDIACGIESTTGQLGQGLANGVGMALAERMLAARFGGDALVDHYTYVLAGDGCLMEGISHEAIGLAGHLGLNKLIVLFDDNQSSIDGPTSLAVTEDTLARFRANGWAAHRVNGHDPIAISAAIAAARESDRPTLIACRTIIAYGAPTKGGTAATHGSPLGKEEAAATRQNLGWTHGEFEIPDPILAAWRKTGQRSTATRQAWERRLGALDPDARAAWDTLQQGTLPEGLDAAVSTLKRRLTEQQPKWATRRAGQDVLELLTSLVPQMVGGSADLTGSNHTKTPSTLPITAASYAGRYIHYGIREHAMASVMSGMVLHNGFIPYGGSFLIFADYARPGIRMAALMELRTIFVMTHDSIGLGEDGPTHQPVEQLPALRAIHNLDVFRPADAVEVAECWTLALRNTTRPSMLVLTRQAVPPVRLTHTEENLCARGAYVIADVPAGATRDVTLLATGSEVAVALGARERLAAEGLEAAVVSMPCWSVFERQPAEYRAAVLGSAPRVAVEAAAPFGWTRYIASEDDFVGVRGFGISGPYQVLYQRFGITPDGVAGRARALIAARREANRS